MCVCAQHGAVLVPITWAGYMLLFGAVAAEILLCCAWSILISGKDLPFSWISYKNNPKAFWMMGKTQGIVHREASPLELSKGGGTA